MLPALTTNARERRVVRTGVHNHRHTLRRGPHVHVRKVGAQALKQRRHLRVAAATTTAAAAANTQQAPQVPSTQPALLPLVHGDPGGAVQSH